jgi:hypothetical protein
MHTGVISLKPNMVGTENQIKSLLFPSFCFADRFSFRKMSRLPKHLINPEAIHKIGLYMIFEEEDDDCCCDEDCDCEDEE